jgi:putative ABC transport system ATP-binding protein
LLLSLNRELGTTLVVVTHDQELAGRAARIVHLAAGKVARVESAP